MKGYRSCVLKCFNYSLLLFFIYFLMKMITDEAVEVYFGLRLLDRAADHACCHNYPGVNRARELRQLQLSLIHI